MREVVVSTTLAEVLLELLEVSVIAALFCGTNMREKPVDILDLGLDLPDDG